ncbi:MAG: glycosyltransferase family 2 protein [Thermoanaerobaculia bacterium]
MEHEIEIERAAAAGGTPDVSVIVVSWNSARWIGRCLRSVGPASGSASFETLVLDNASGDESLALAREAAGERTVILESPSNRGFAGGLNELIPAARGRYILLLNPDCEPQPGAIEALVRHLDATGVAGAAPLLLGEDGEAQREFQLRRFPSVRTLVADALLLNELHPKNRTSAAYRYAETDISEPVAIEQPAGAALMLRREVIERIGAFDERFQPAWFEDVDYCRRIAADGGVLHLVPAARFHHWGGASVDILGFGRFLELWYRNLFRYAEKWLKPAEVELLRWSLMGGMLMRIAASLLGFGRRAGTRREAIRVYTRILQQAWRRWDATSQSS